MPARKNPESGGEMGPIVGENFYVLVIREAMQKDNLSLSEAYIKYCEQIVASDKVQPDPLKEEHLAEAKRAYEFLRARGRH